MRDVKWLGCKRDTRDASDITFKPKAVRLSSKIDLRKWAPPVMNQGELGSCTGHGVTTAFRFLMKRDGLPDIPLSRLQNYYDAREREGFPNEDTGAEIRDNIIAACEKGICREALWDYDIAKFAERPPLTAYENALKFQVLEKRRVPISTTAVRTALQMKLPVIIGISLWSSFESDKVVNNGIVPMPDPDNEENLGGHCMVVEGYENGYLITQNSWDTDFGDQGYVYLPTKYAGSPKYGADYWTIPKAELTDETLVALNNIGEANAVV